MREEIEAEFLNECAKLPAPTKDDYAKVAAVMVAQERSTLEFQLRTFLEK